MAKCTTGNTRCGGRCRGAARLEAHGSATAWTGAGRAQDRDQGDREAARLAVKSIGIDDRTMIVPAAPMRGDDEDPTSHDRDRRVPYFV